MINSFLVISNSIHSDKTKAIEHFRNLCSLYKFEFTKIQFLNFTIFLSVRKQSFVPAFSKSNSFFLGNFNDIPNPYDRFLKIDIKSDELQIENDYAGTIPVFYSYRNGFTASNIEPCVYLASNSSIEDISYENLYGFLRFSHYIWDETAWNHIYQMLPDSIFTFNYESNIPKVDYLNTIKCSNSRVNLTDKQVASELFELNQELVLKTLGDFEQIILPLSSGYDSRMIFSALTNNVQTRKRLKCFTYGNEGSIEVESARRLCGQENIYWKHINLPCRFLTKFDLRAISNIFGASMHMHGMYQLEFFNQIKLHINTSENSVLTSGFMTGVPAGQHNGLFALNSRPDSFCKLMMVFPQSKVWSSQDLSMISKIDLIECEKLANERFSKAFDRFDGEIYQKSVVFDVWTRQRNFISYYPRLFEWLIPTISPHMCADYINFFMSLSSKHLCNRKAVELMFKYHYNSASRIISNSNGLKSITGIESNLYLLSRILTKIKCSYIIPKKYKINTFDFDLQAINNCGQDAFYPFLSNNEFPIPFLKEFYEIFGGKDFFEQLYFQCIHGDSSAYLKLITMQSIALNADL